VCFAKPRERSLSASRQAALERIMSEEEGGKSRALLWAAAVLLALLGVWFLLPVKQWLDGFEAYVADLGVWGFLLFGLAYVVGTVLLAPGLALTLAAAFAFGLWAFPLVMVAATTGAALAFLIGRYAVRGAVARLVQDRPVLKAVERAIAEDGGKIVLLMRLSPLVPFNLQNYAFGVTGVGFWPYVAATFVGIAPGALVFVLVGAAGQRAGDEGFGWPFWILFAAGLAATVWVTVIVTRKARAKLATAGVDA
jgi:uncharacterized membrane protein YdjX (TVP38/TMEM64 family)